MFSMVRLTENASLPPTVSGEIAQELINNSGFFTVSFPDAPGALGLTGVFPSVMVT